MPYLMRVRAPRPYLARFDSVGPLWTDDVRLATDKQRVYALIDLFEVDRVRRSGLWYGITGLGRLESRRLLVNGDLWGPFNELVLDARYLRRSLWPCEWCTDARQAAAFDHPDEDARLGDLGRAMLAWLGLELEPVDEAQELLCPT